MAASKIFKIIAGIIGTILLGALGSGLWEKILSPCLTSFSSWIVREVGSIYSGYLDSIYYNAAKDIPDIYNRKIAFLILLISGIWLIAIGLKHKFTNDFEHLFSPRHKAMFRWGLTVWGGTLIVMACFSIMTSDYSQRIKAYSHHSIEILRPYIGENEYFILKSNYYRIKNVNDFKAFNNNLIRYSTKFNIELPSLQQ